MPIFALVGNSWFGFAVADGAVELATATASVVLMEFGSVLPPVEDANEAVVSKGGGEARESGRDRADGVSKGAIVAFRIILLTIEPENSEMHVFISRVNFMLHHTVLDVNVPYTSSRSPLLLHILPIHHCRATLRQQGSIGRATSLLRERFRGDGKV